MHEVGLICSCSFQWPCPWLRKHLLRPVPLVFDYWRGCGICFPRSSWYDLRGHLFSSTFLPDITVMVDWALNINYLSIYPVLTTASEKAQGKGTNSPITDIVSLTHLFPLIITPELFFLHLPFRPHVTPVVDWALKIKYQSLYPLTFTVQFIPVLIGNTVDFSMSKAAAARLCRKGVWAVVWAGERSGVFIMQSIYCLRIDQFAHIIQSKEIPWEKKCALIPLEY